MNQNEAHEDIKKRARKKKVTKTASAENEPEIMMSELLSAISEAEYPQYILEAIERVREWMNDMITKPEDSFDETDIFSSLFGQGFDDEPRGLDALFAKLEDLKKYADVIPNPNTPDGKPDTIIISITPSDYESGLRTAIDYAAVFNRSKCQRVWIISDTFIFDEIVKFSPHVDALAEQGITLRFVLVTPWGWVELPLSGNTASKRQFLWRTNELHDEGMKPRRKKQ